MAYEEFDKFFWLGSELIAILDPLRRTAFAAATRLLWDDDVIWFLFRFGCTLRLLLLSKSSAYGWAYVGGWGSSPDVQGELWVICVLTGWGYFGIDEWVCYWWCMIAPFVYLFYTLFCFIFTEPNGVCIYCCLNKCYGGGGLYFFIFRFWIRRLGATKFYYFAPPPGLNANTLILSRWPLC
jgi:hypothetical protein